MSLYLRNCGSTTNIHALIFREDQETHHNQTSWNYIGKLFAYIVFTCSSLPSATVHTFRDASSEPVTIHWPRPHITWHRIICEWVTWRWLISSSTDHRVILYTNTPQSINRVRLAVHQKTAVSHVEISGNSNFNGNIKTVSIGPNIVCQCWWKLLGRSRWWLSVYLTYNSR